MATQVIRSEDDAFNLLQELVRKEGQFDIGDLDVQFSGWPNLEIYAKGERYQQTISPAMMKSFLALQSAVYRSYALSKYNSPNVNKLTKQEKEALEIRVKVEKGSSNFSLDLQKLAEHFIDGAMGKMTGDQLLIVMITAMLLLFGHIAIKQILEHRRQVRTEELSAGTQREQLAVMQTMTQEETKRAELMQKLVQENSKIDNLYRIAYDANMDMLKGLETAELSNFQGVPLNAEQAHLLVQNARRKSNQIRLDGKFRILGVDSSLKSDFKLRVLSLESHEEFVAQVQEKDLTMSATAKLQQAEWERRPIMLHINASEQHGQIKKAVIVAVGEVDPPKDA